MATTIAFNGTPITSANSITGFGVVKITSGGGTPSVAVADGAIQGSGAVTTTASGKRIILYYDVGAANVMDFSGNIGIFSTHELIYIWGNFLAPGLLNSSTAGGFGVFLESNTPSASQYKLWYFYGNNNYTGGWKRFVIDPALTPSASAGSALNLSAIRYVGLFAETTSTARFDNLIVDSMDRGFGLTISGTSASPLITELLDWESTNRKGVVTSLNDSATAAELRGRVDLDSSSGYTISDTNGKLFLDAPVYYNGSSFIRSAQANSFGVNITGSTNSQTATFGAKVGTSGGRNGTTFVGNSVYNMDIVAGDSTLEQANFYGCSFELFSGGIAIYGAASEVMGCTFAQCGLITFENATVSETLFVQTQEVGLTNSTMSDCRFINPGGSIALSASNGVSQLSNCIFTSSGTGHAIELTSGTSHTFNNITFNNYATSNGSTGNEAVFVNIASGNVTINSDSALSYRTAGATVTVIAGQKTLTVSGVVSGSDIVILSAGTSSVLESNDGATNPVTSFDYSYTYSAGTYVDIAVYKAGYVPYIVRNYLLPANGGSVQTAQVLDRNYTP